jgi:hypothetical protein
LLRRGEGRGEGVEWFGSFRRCLGSAEKGYLAWSQLTTGARRGQSQGRRRATRCDGEGLSGAEKGSGTFIGDARAGARERGSAGRRGRLGSIRTAPGSEDVRRCDVPGLLSMRASWGRGDLGERALGRRVHAAIEVKGAGVRRAGTRWRRAPARRRAGARPRRSANSMCHCSTR